MARPGYAVDECPRWTKCVGPCNVCWFNCDHLKVTKVEANEEGRAEWFCNGCESMLLALPNGGWEVID